MPRVTLSPEFEETKATMRGLIAERELAINECELQLSAHKSYLKALQDALEAIVSAQRGESHKRSHDRVKAIPHIEIEDLPETFGE